MLTSLASANLAARFFAELAAFTALGAAGWRTEGPVVGVLVAVVAIVVWGAFASPHPAVAAGAAVRTVAQVVVLGGSVVALMATGSMGLGVAFGVALVINTMLIATLPEPHWAAA